MSQLSAVNVKDNIHKNCATHRFTQLCTNLNFNTLFIFCSLKKKHFKREKFTCLESLFIILKLYIDRIQIASSVDFRTRYLLFCLK